MSGCRLQPVSACVTMVTSVGRSQSSACSVLLMMAASFCGAARLSLGFTFSACCEAYIHIIIVMLSYTLIHDAIQIRCEIVNSCRHLDIILCMLSLCNLYLCMCDVRVCRCVCVRAPCVCACMRKPRMHARIDKSYYIMGVWSARYV